jgi:polysaccharide biosynthesis protein PslH
MLQILCGMRLPPAQNGHGGSQRAWRFLQALHRLGNVHLVLLHRKTDLDMVSTHLAPAISLCATTTLIEIEDWEPSITDTQPRLLNIRSGWYDLFKVVSHEAPRFSLKTLHHISSKIPIHSPDLIFAGRLPVASIFESLITNKLITAQYKVADFDDILSRFYERQLATMANDRDLEWRLLKQIDIAVIRRAEVCIGKTWDSISVCSDNDVEILTKRIKKSSIIKVPNVVSRDQLPFRSFSLATRLLFVGNFRFLPNVQGLKTFVANGWPLVKRAINAVSLTLVGLHPTAWTHAFAKQHQLELHCNVPSVESFYYNSDIVIVPIFQGSGTRLKLLEAMAFGRPIVTTTIGAEGLGLVDKEHALIADDMKTFAAGIAELATNRELARKLVENSRRLQQNRFSTDHFEEAANRFFSSTLADRIT